MCLGIPARIVEKISATEGIVELNGVRYKANLMLVEGLNENDYVIIHAGFAIQKVDEGEALETLQMIAQAMLDQTNDMGEPV